MVRMALGLWKWTDRLFAVSAIVVVVLLLRLEFIVRPNSFGPLALCAVVCSAGFDANRVALRLGRVGLVLFVSNVGLLVLAFAWRFSQFLIGHYFESRLTILIVGTVAVLIYGQGLLDRTREIWERVGADTDQEQVVTSPA